MKPEHEHLFKINRWALIFQDCRSYGRRAWKALGFAKTYLQRTLEMFATDQLHII